MVATGAVFGPEQPLIIHLLGHEGGNHDKLHGLAMELTDGAFPLVLVRTL